MNDSIICPKCKHDNGTVHTRPTCKECGFAFVTFTLNRPRYRTECVKHEWGKFEETEREDGTPVEVRNCKLCGKVDFK